MNVVVSGVRSNVSGILDSFDRNETMWMWWVAIENVVSV